MADASEDGRQEAAPGSTCTTCGRTFASLAGRRLHERRSHGNSYHAEEMRRLEARTKDRWDQEELVLMADFERTYTGPGVNIEVRRSVLPHRTFESIKGMRRQVKYRRLLEEGTSGSAHRRLSPPPPVVGVRTGEFDTK